MGSGYTGGQSRYCRLGAYCRHHRQRHQVKGQHTRYTSLLSLRLLCCICRFFPRITLNLRIQKKCNQILKCPVCIYNFAKWQLSRRRFTLNCPWKLNFICQKCNLITCFCFFVISFWHTKTNWSTIKASV